MDQKPDSQIYYILDYGLDEEKFLAILQGKQIIGRLDRDWAAVKLLEFGTYQDIVRLLGFASLVENWPRWRSMVTLASRRRGIDFLTSWLTNNHPELCDRVPKQDAL